MHSVTTALDYIQSKGHKVLAVIHYLKKKDGEMYQISRNYEKPYFKDYGITDSKSFNQFFEIKKNKSITHIGENLQTYGKTLFRVCSYCWISILHISFIFYL